MAATITAIDGTAVPKLFQAIGSFVQLAAAHIEVAATVTSVSVTFPQLNSIDGIVGLTVRTTSTGAVRTNVDLTATVSGNVLTISEQNAFNLDADTCIIDVLVWGKAKLA